MGRRSSFPRIPKDLYETWDPRAVPPLLPHIPKGTRYAEPCAGHGALIQQLDGHLELAWASDISPSSDPRVHENDVLQVSIGDADIFLTNPPWTRALLHQIIVHLSDQAPTWLLFDSNWANTKQARPFMERCRRIVTVGRLKWIRGTKNDPKDDVSFYLFDRPIAGSAPLFYGQGCVPAEAMKRPRRICHDCGVMIDRFGKWRLQQRNGTLTPCHVNCEYPSGLSAAPGPAPLLDYLDQLPAAHHLQVVK